MFRFLGSRLSALFEWGASRKVASRIEIRFEPIAPANDPGPPGDAWDRIIVRPAGEDVGPGHPLSETKTPAGAATE